MPMPTVSIIARIFLALEREGDTKRPKATHLQRTVHLLGLIIAVDKLAKHNDGGDEVNKTPYFITEHWSILAQGR